MSDEAGGDKLDQAWHWYLAARDISRWMARLGEEYWFDLPWEGKMANDPLFQSLEEDRFGTTAKDVLASLEDIAILVIFSAFEASLRERVISDLAADTEAVRHPSSVRAMRDLNRAIDKGSIDRILIDCDGVDASLVMGARKIRDYRNWVGHGRRGAQPAEVVPDDAYRLLRRFLDRLEGLS